MRKLTLALTAIGLVATPALAAPCRDGHGKFVKCTTKAPAAKPTKCRGAKGKFVKCPAK